MGGLSIGANPNPLTLPERSKIGDLKTLPSKKNGATLRIDRRCEVTVVANAPKYSVDSH